MKLLEVETPPYIYHVLSTRKALWEENFTLVTMTSYRRLNVRKHGEIKNGEQYIAMDIYLNLDCMDKIEVTSSE